MTTQYYTDYNHIYTKKHNKYQYIGSPQSSIPLTQTLYKLSDLNSILLNDIRHIINSYQRELKVASCTINEEYIQIIYTGDHARTNRLTINNDRILIRNNYTKVTKAIQLEDYTKDKLGLII